MSERTEKIALRHRKVPKAVVVGALEMHARTLEQMDRILGQFNGELAVLRRGFWGRLRWLVTGK
jgi:hypothetical protein